MKIFKHFRTQMTKSNTMKILPLNAVDYDGLKDIE